MGEMDRRVALVTGAAQGIGRAVVDLLLERGLGVALNDLDAGRLDALAESLGPQALPLAGDVTGAGIAADLVRRTVGQWGRLDVLVTAAGILAPTRFREIPEAEWRRTIDVNLTAVFLCMQAAVEPMVRGGFGRIVNVSSTAGKSVSTLGGAHYTASKAGVLGLTRAAAKELAPHGITVNAVCPGLIDTEMVRRNVAPERLEAYRTSFPIPRLGTPREVAELIGFLASDQAAYITGAAFDITGGDLMV
ncbi:MAG: SDR family oxidoreductase [Gemmatimonadetes bacterium]|nr:SDR family oxidoreductase [Gemmatimonadota bacterium]